MRDTAITGEKVGGEQKAETLAEETHMPVSVPWKMDGTQAVPNVDEVAVVEPAVGNKWTKAQNRPANALQAASDSRPAAIVRVAGVVVGVEPRGGDPSAGLARNDGHIEDVIKVSVRDDNTSNRLTLPATSLKCAAQMKAPANESSVEQVQPRCVPQDVVVERWRPDLENIGMQEWRQLTRRPTSAGRRGGAGVNREWWAGVKKP